MIWCMQEDPFDSTTCSYPFKLVFIQSNNHLEKWLIEGDIKPANSWCKHVFSNILVEQGPFKIFTSLSHLKNLWGFSFYLSHINSTYKNAKMPSFFSKTPWVCAPSQRPSHPQRWAGPPTWPRFLQCPLWRWRVGQCYWPWLGCFQKIGGFYPKRDQWKLMEKNLWKMGWFGGVDHLSWLMGSLHSNKNGKQPFTTTELVSLSAPNTAYLTSSWSKS